MSGCKGDDHMNRIANRIKLAESKYSFRRFEDAKNEAIRLSKEEGVDYIVFMPGLESEIYELDTAPGGKTDIPSSYIFYYTGDDKDKEENKN